VAARKKGFKKGEPLRHSRNSSTLLSDCRHNETPCQPHGNAPKSREGTAKPVSNPRISRHVTDQLTRVGVTAIRSEV
jgi:hypothetical protein